METERPRGEGQAAPETALSVVAPALDEEETIAPFFARLEPVLDDLGVSWELIVVDDGSRDGTWGEVRRLHDGDPRVQGVRLSRNFGHQYALLAGISRARGRAVVTMDVDLQHPPEVIPELVREWRDGSRIVHAVRRHSRGVSLLKRLSSRLFYRVFSFLSGTRLESGMADYRLLDRRAVDGLLGFREEGLFLRGIVRWMGFPDSRVEFEAEPRHKGRTKYSLAKMIKLMWAGVSSFSLVPLRLAVIVGLLTSLFAVEQLVEAIYRKVVLGVTVPGWTQIMVVLTFLFGVLFILLGILGEYIGRILVEVRGRPRYLVEEELTGEVPDSRLPSDRRGSSGSPIGAGD